MAKRSRILLIQLQQLGDALLSSALLEDLREAYPSATLDFLTRPLAGELIAGNPFATDVISYDATRTMGMLRDIRARGYDLVIDVQSNARSAAIAFASRARERVGWEKGLRSVVYTTRVPRPQSSEYVVRYRQRLLQRAGIETRSRYPRIFLSAPEREAGERRVTAIPGAAHARKIAMVLSARAAGSIWPVDRFAATAESLARDGHIPVVLPTAGDEALVAECLNLAPSARRADFPGLREFVAGLAAFDLLICGSTGPSHMGMAVGTPTLTLFGADDATTWNAGLPATVAVSSPRAQCAACAVSATRMAAAHTCMQEISVAEVVDRARALLAST